MSASGEEYYGTSSDEEEVDYRYAITRAPRPGPSSNKPASNGIDFLKWTPKNTVTEQLLGTETTGDESPPGSSEPSSIRRDGRRSKIGSRSVSRSMSIRGKSLQPSSTYYSDGRRRTTRRQSSASLSEEGEDAEYGRQRRIGSPRGYKTKAGTAPNTRTATQESDSEPTEYGHDHPRGPGRYKLPRLVRESTPGPKEEESDYSDNDSVSSLPAPDRSICMESRLPPSLQPLLDRFRPRGERQNSPPATSFAPPYSSYVPPTLYPDSRPPHPGAHAGVRPGVLLDSRSTHKTFAPETKHLRDRFSHNAERGPCSIGTVNPSSWGLNGGYWRGDPSYRPPGSCQQCTLNQASVQASMAAYCPGCCRAGATSQSAEQSYSIAQNTGYTLQNWDSRAPSGLPGWICPTGTRTNPAYQPRYPGGYKLTPL